MPGRIAWWAAVALVAAGCTSGSRADTPTTAANDQADSDRLLGWLAQRGLAPHGHSHQRVDNRRQTDLERLARLSGTRLDRSFLEVMLARDRAGIGLCLAEVRHGRLADVRELARRMLADQQREVHQLRAWWTATSRHRRRQAVTEGA